MAAPKRTALSGESGIEVVILEDNPELAAKARELIEEFLRLEDSWVWEVSSDGRLPDFLRCELEALPEHPSRPEGAVALALVAGEAMGTGQIRRLDQETCELARLYVREPVRRRGVGTLLINALSDQARGLGYRRIYLDTMSKRSGSVAFYERLGFERTEPVHDWGEGVVSFCRKLGV